MDVAPFLGLRARLALGCTLGPGCATLPAVPGHSYARPGIPVAEGQYVYFAIFFSCATYFFSCSRPDAAADAGLRPGRPGATSFAMTKSRSGTPRSFRALLFGFVQGPVSSAAQTHPALLPDASSVHPNALRGMTRGL